LSSFKILLQIEYNKFIEKIFKACEMLLFDKKLTAAETYERNLVTRIIPHNSFYEETERLVSYKNYIFIKIFKRFLVFLNCRQNH